MDSMKQQFLEGTETDGGPYSVRTATVLRTTVPVPKGAKAPCFPRGLSDG